MKSHFVFPGIVTLCNGMYNYKNGIFTELANRCYQIIVAIKLYDYYQAICCLCLTVRISSVSLQMEATSTWHSVRVVTHSLAVRVRNARLTLTLDQHKHYLSFAFIAIVFERS